MFSESKRQRQFKSHGQFGKISDNSKISSKKSKEEEK
jgi:hypothetical protein